MTPAASLLHRLPGAGRAVRALGVGGVPATGYFGAGWSIGTLLVLYWLETVLVTVAVAIVVLRHRRATGTAGHWDVEYTVTTSRSGKRSTRSGKTTFLRAFLGVMVPFTAVHGLFVGAFAFAVFPQEVGPAAGVSTAALADGLLGIGVFVLAGLGLDLVGIGRRPFRWVEHLGQRAQSRMLVTHLTIIFGAAALAFFGAPGAFLAVFVALKSLVDFGGMLPEREPKEETPSAVARLGRWLPKKDGKSFDDLYREAIEAEAARQRANERTLPPAARLRPGPGEHSLD
jgi:hypothetical protein